MSTKSKTKSISLGLVHEMLVVLEKHGFTPEMAEKIQKDEYIAWRIVLMISNLLGDYNPIETWRMIYRKYFNKDIDESLFEEGEGYFPIYVVDDLSIEQIFKTIPFKKSEGVLKTEDLNQIIFDVDRDCYSEGDFIHYIDINELKEGGDAAVYLKEILLLYLYFFTITGRVFTLEQIRCMDSRVQAEKGEEKVPVVSITQDGKLMISEQLLSK